MNYRTHAGAWLAAMLTISATQAGPYSAGLNDNANSYDAPVPGFVGPHGAGKARINDGTGEFQNPNNRLNPLFFAWASVYSSYQRSDTDTSSNEPEYGLGPVTGDNFDVVSLGDLTATQITGGSPAGRITLRFAKPIRDFSGADFVIFENGFISGFNTGGSGVGGVFAELAYVEVSADGVNFQRFNPTSLTPSSVGTYGTIDPTNIYNLAGKHVNAYGDCWGTPFDIGQTGLSEISYIRLVDIPGSGAFKDGGNRSIYDSWRTFGSGGFDLEAVGSISTAMTFGQWPLLAELPINMRGTTADPDKDGISNLMEYAFGLLPWERNSQGTGWKSQIIKVGEDSFFEFTTLRDERCSDLVRDIQVSEDLKVWTSIARSTAGGPFLAQNGFTPTITDQRVGDLVSVGVLREDRVRDTRSLSGAEKRFYRLKITRLTP